jgi:uncharacterized protein HemY
VLAQPLTQLAWAKVERGLPGAEADARQAFALQNRSLQRDHPDRAVSLTWLGYVLLRQNQLAEARTHLEEAIALRRKAFPAVDWRTLPATGVLAEVRIRSGQRAEGLKLLGEQVTALERAFGKDNPRTRDAREVWERYSR